MQLQSKTSRIIASDFDGTLMRGQSVTEADAEAIKEWQDRGNLRPRNRQRSLRCKKSRGKSGRGILRLYNMLFRSLYTRLRRKMRMEQYHEYFAACRAYRFYSSKGPALAVTEPRHGNVWHTDWIKYPLQTRSNR